MEAKVNILIRNKFMATILIFVLATTMVSLPLSAREWRGSTVEVTLIDGRSVKGELLAVKNYALLVHNPDIGRGEILDFQQVVKVEVLKKAKALQGLAIGLGVALGASFFNAYILKNGMPNHEDYTFGLGLSVLVPVTGTVGWVLGAFAGIPKKFSLAGTSSRRMQQNLERLKRYARKKDADFAIVKHF